MDGCYFSLCGPAMNWSLIQGVTMPLSDGWERLPLTSRSGLSWSRKWMFLQQRQLNSQISFFEFWLLLFTLFFNLCEFLWIIFRWFTLAWIQTERSWSFWLHPFLVAFIASHASLDLPSLCGSQVGCKIPAGGKMKTFDGKHATCRRNRSLTVVSSAFPEGNQDLN